MTKVFSIKAYIEDQRKEGYSERFIEREIKRWVGKNEGLTEEEMWEKNRSFTQPEWMVEEGK